ncbi:MAG: PIN/TRAM domain-containing protein [Armatimonadota bacterium]
MNTKIWRFLFTLVLAGIAGLLGWYGAERFVLYLSTARIEGLTGAWTGPVYKLVFVTCGIIFGIELGRTFFRRIESQGDRLGRMSARDKLALGTGLMVGLVLSAVLSLPVLMLLGSQKPAAVAVTLLLGTIVTYFCMAAAFSMKEELRVYLPPAREEEIPPKERYKILDTNVIIDGRVSDIVRCGFLDGTIYVPGFVLDELQHIADSADSLKRARGRRGLDILNQMQKESPLVVRSFDRLAPGNEEVDARLVRLTKALDGMLVTNDFNLNRVAELQGVPVLNINELANALKPVVLPGEEMKVLIVKEGRESSQGVGYLDDGTMIVVEGGRRFIGESVEIVVSSLLQTTAGKMIFAQVRGDEVDEEDYGRGVRPYAGGGTRRPVRGDRR